MVASTKGCVALVTLTSRVHEYGKSQPQMHRMKFLKPVVGAGGKGAKKTHWASALLMPKEYHDGQISKPIRQVDFVGPGGGARLPRSWPLRSRRGRVGGLCLADGGGGLPWDSPS